jgi:protein-S-isoprenylcysteine O-methyltransferase Ste14
LLPLVKLIPMPWVVLRLLPIACGIVMNLIADQAFRKADTTVKPFQESTSLITDGVFRYSRNPMHLGFALALVGVAVFFGSYHPGSSYPFLSSW